VEDGNHGEYRPRPDEFCSEGTHFIRAADMDSGRVLFESAQRINEPARERIRKGIGAGGDVLLSHKGTVGKVAYVPEDAPPFVCSPQTTFWRVEDSNQLDRRYLYFFLLSRAFREQLDSRKGETDMADYVSLTTQRTLKVTVPPLPEQQAIAAVLGALDDKIELNRRMNATLEAMAGALFKSWFVDFDPVRAKLTGRKPERLDKETAALFPSTFQDSFLGKIPTGWTATTLGEACQSGGGDIQTGPFGSQLHAADYVPQGIPSIMPSDLRDNRIDATSIARIREEDAERLAAYRVRTGDIVYSRRGDVERRSLIRRGEDGWLCGTGCLRVRFGARGVDSHWGACHLGTAESREWVVRHAVGATMPNLNTSILGELPVLVPPSELQSLFGHIVGPWDERGTVALEESRTLATLRDTLLPQLLSGHLRVERE
jgi:type I restriction enzyme S subunit